MPEPARRRTAALVITGMVLGGAGTAAYFVLSRPDPPPPPAPSPATEGPDSPEGVARSVIEKLNAKDLDGVIDLTCAQGKSTGRRELTKAVPHLDPATPASTRAKPIEFELGRLSQFPDGYVATFTVRFDGNAQEGTMRLQLSSDRWTLCGMDSPRIGGVG
ncbi:hypothetical protein KIPE111705_46155 [Kibdelosporangium persicum]|uniref:DUF4878 domain-containing protein n=1 Tax=Kibdelosporangium persicum TaxID=2698649 RepID=A0ABX2FKU5_9PSEU|nr:hypothetical protein [Kibdelosporangium persicum]NRN71416.1 hypothetical protein [Kibdelosporangium persicum]